MFTDRMLRFATDGTHNFFERLSEPWSALSSVSAGPFASVGFCPLSISLPTKLSQSTVALCFMPLSAPAGWTEIRADFCRSRHRLRSPRRGCRRSRRRRLRCAATSGCWPRLDVYIAFVVINVTLDMKIMKVRGVSRLEAAWLAVPLPAAPSVGSRSPAAPALRCGMEEQWH